MVLGLNLDTHSPSDFANNALRNALTNNNRAPQTPTVHNNPVDGAFTVITAHQNNVISLPPIEDDLPDGYVNCRYILFYLILMI